jgi:hypothetical protein
MNTIYLLNLILPLPLGLGRGNSWSTALIDPDDAVRRTGFAQQSSPLKRQEVASASKNADFAMTCQKKTGCQATLFKP